MLLWVDHRRLVLAGVIFDLEPIRRFIGTQILKAKMVLVTPHLIIVSFDILISFPLLSKSPLFGLSLYSDLVKVDFLGSTQYVIYSYVVFRC